MTTYLGPFRRLGKIVVNNRSLKEELPDNISRQRFRFIARSGTFLPEIRKSLKKDRTEQVETRMKMVRDCLGADRELPLQCYVTFSQ